MGTVNLGRGGAGVMATAVQAELSKTFERVTQLVEQKITTGALIVQDKAGFLASLSEKIQGKQENWLAAEKSTRRFGRLSAEMMRDTANAFAGDAGPRVKNLVKAQVECGEVVVADDDVENFIKEIVAATVVPAA